MARAWAVITTQVFSMTLGSVPGDFPSDLYEGFVKFLQAPQSSCFRRTLVTRTYLRQTFTQIRSRPSSTRRIAEAMIMTELETIPYGADRRQTPQAAAPRPSGSAYSFARTLTHQVSVYARQRSWDATTSCRTGASRSNGLRTPARPSRRLAWAV